MIYEMPNMNVIMYHMARAETLRQEECQKFFDMMLSFMSKKFYQDMLLRRWLQLARTPYERRTMRQAIRSLRRYYVYSRGYSGTLPVLDFPPEFEIGLAPVFAPKV
jgi:hypothetical protein